MSKAAHSQHSVHYTSANFSSGHKVETVTDAGEKEGIQQITVTENGQSGKGTVIFSGGSAYLKGDAFAMHTFFGFPEATATKYAGKWIAVPDTSPAIDTIAADVTFPSFLNSLFQPMANLSLVPQGDLIAVKGTIHRPGAHVAEAAVVAPAHGKPLPVTQNERTQGAHASQGTVHMSKWDEPVHVTAPNGAVPLANLAPSG
jgi:hypothetical protein